MNTSRRLDFYFDIISPYAYLAWTQLPPIIAEFNLDLHTHPVLLAALFNHYGQKGPAEIPEKRHFTIVDMLRWANHYKVSIEGPPTHPFNPLTPLRCVLAIEASAKRTAFAGALLTAVWGKGQDPTDEKTLATIAQSVGLDGKVVLERAASEPVKQSLKESTAKAIGAGVFGVPTFIVDDQLFWGNDRLVFLRDYLKSGTKPDPALLERILGRPASATRR